MKADRNEKKIWKDAEGIPRYSIGEISKYCGIHPQTIRFFEKEHLVSPLRTSESNRRRYSTYDIYQILLRAQYRNMGFSTKETEDMLHLYDREAIEQQIRSHREQLEKEKKGLELRIRGTDRLNDAVERIPLAFGHCVFQKRPSMVACPHQRNGIYDRSEVSGQARKWMMDTMPLSFFLFAFPQQQQEDYCWYIGIEAEYAQDTAFRPEWIQLEIPERLCLYTIFSIENDDAINPGCLHDAFVFIERNGWKVDGTIYGSAIVNSSSGGKTVRYFEAWIPVMQV